MATPLASHLRPLFLLVRAQDLVESGFRFGMICNRLRGQVADVGSCLGDGILVVVFDGRLQALMCGLHAAAHGSFVADGIGEDGCGLLLLLLVEAQLVGQKLNAPLHHGSRVVRMPFAGPLRVYE